MGENFMKCQIAGCTLTLIQRATCNQFHHPFSGDELSFKWYHQSDNDEDNVQVTEFVVEILANTLFQVWHCQATVS